MKTIPYTYFAKVISCLRRIRHFLGNRAAAHRETCQLLPFPHLSRPTAKHPLQSVSRFFLISFHVAFELPSPFEREILFFPPMLPRCCRRNRFYFALPPLFEKSKKTDGFVGFRSIDNLLPILFFFIYNLLSNIDRRIFRHFSLEIVNRITR